MKKRILALLLAGVMAFALMACGSTDDAADDSATGDDAASGDDAAGDDVAASDIEVGFVVKSLADQYWVLVKAGAEAAAADLGVNLTFVGPNSEADVQQQVSMIENLISTGVDALCVAPSSPDAVLPAFESAHEKGIPVLAVDTDTTFENKLTFIGTGNEDAGKLGGEYAASIVGEGANAIVLRGRLGDKTHDDREAGFVAGLEAGGVNVLEVVAADSEAEEGMNKTQNLLQTYDNIDVIVTTADSMAQGAQRAVEQAGKSEDIKILGFDGTIPVVEMTIEGLVLGSVAQNPYEMGYLGVENAVKAVKGEEVEARIDSGAEVVNADNAQTFLDDLNAKLGE